MEKSDRKIELTKQEKRSSLEAKFWNDKQKIDKNTSRMQKIEKICNFFEAKKKIILSRKSGLYLNGYCVIL